MFPRNCVVMGDTHGEWYLLNIFLSSHKVDTIIQCGDFGYWPRESEYDLSKIKNGDTKIYWCDGNHEDHYSLSLIGENNEVAPNIFYMKRGSVLTLDNGIKVLFMGGAKSIDKNQRIMGYDWFPEEEISYKDIDNLPDCKVHAVISHTVPRSFLAESGWQDSQELAERFNDPSTHALDYVFDKYRPELWLSGHFHRFKQKIIKDCLWTSLSHSGSLQRWWIKI